MLGLRFLEFLTEGGGGGGGGGVSTAGEGVGILWGRPRPRFLVGGMAMWVAVWLVGICVLGGTRLTRLEAVRSASARCAEILRATGLALCASGCGTGFLGIATRRCTDGSDGTVFSAKKNSSVVKHSVMRPKDIHSTRLLTALPLDEARVALLALLG